jgi:hypothetical protein
MKNVGFVTGPVRECGIHAYASCVYEILRLSDRHNFYFLEASTAEEFIELSHRHQITSVIYNWHPATIPWCSPEFTKNVSDLTQIMIIGHELNDQMKQFENIDAYLTIDPTLPQVDNYYPGVRPINYYTDIQYRPHGEVLKIGTSGFGHFKKGLPFLIKILNDQFKTEPVELNIHFSVGHYVDASGGAARHAIQSALSDVSLNDNIQLNVTHQFFEKYDLIRWLNGNDINIFCHDHYSGPGVSSSVDRAIAAMKPIGVNDSNYFKHIRKNEIDINQTPIKEIIKAGIEPLKDIYIRWNPITLLEQYEFLIDTYDKK